jgi:hypothetical protein
MVSHDHDVYLAGGGRPAGMSNRTWSLIKSRGTFFVKPEAVRKALQQHAECIRLLAPADPVAHTRDVPDLRIVSLHRGLGLAAICLATLLAGCSRNDPAGPGPSSAEPRTYRLGFSGFPPRPDFASAFAALEMWTGRRSDGAIMHFELPWDSLLAGVRPDSIVVRNLLGLANYYRAKGLELTVTVDLTNGLDRASEAPGLVAAGRSLTEPAIQDLCQQWVVAVDTLLHPTNLGLAAETNLIRAAAPPALYAAVVQVANDAASNVRAYDTSVRLYVSVQVETAWGALGGGSPTYVGISQDLADFPFAQAIGLSSYPFLGGFAEPDSVPLDYYSRIRDQASRPVLVVEGGWTSASVGGITSSPEKQARWIRRHMQLADRCGALAVFQLSFTDLDLSAFPPQPPGSILPLFAHLGLVDADLRPKPALATWDSAFARPRR